MNVKEVWVMTDTYNAYHNTYAHIIPIVPLKSVQYKVISRHNYGNIEYDKTKFSLVYLTKRMRFNVEYSLLSLNLEPSEYIEKVTPHNEWKKTMWQGICFTPCPRIACGENIILPEHNMNEYKAIHWLKENSYIRVVSDDVIVVR